MGKGEGPSKKQLAEIEKAKAVQQLYGQIAAGEPVLRLFPNTKKKTLRDPKLSRRAELIPIGETWYTEDKLAVTRQDDDGNMQIEGRAVVKLGVHREDLQRTELQQRGRAGIDASRRRSRRLSLDLADGAGPSPRSQRPALTIEQAALTVQSVYRGEIARRKHLPVLEQRDKDRRQKLVAAFYGKQKDAERASVEAEERERTLQLMMPVARQLFEATGLSGIFDKLGVAAPEAAAADAAAAELETAAPVTMMLAAYESDEERASAEEESAAAVELEPAGEETDLFDIEFVQPGSLGLAYKVSGLASAPLDMQNFMYVNKIVKQSQASLFSTLTKGCVLESVDGVAVAGQTYSDVMAVLKQGIRPVTLTFSPPPGADGQPAGTASGATGAAAAQSPGKPAPAAAAALSTTHALRISRTRRERHATARVFLRWSAWTTSQTDGRAVAGELTRNQDRVDELTEELRNVRLDLKRVQTVYRNERHIQRAIATRICAQRRRKTTLISVFSAWATMTAMPASAIRRVAQKAEQVDEGEGDATQHGRNALAQQLLAVRETLETAEVRAHVARDAVAALAGSNGTGASLARIAAQTMLEAEQAASQYVTVIAEAAEASLEQERSTLRMARLVRHRAAAICFKHNRREALRVAFEQWRAYFVNLALRRQLRVADKAVQERDHLATALMRAKLALERAQADGAVKTAMLNESASQAEVDRNATAALLATKLVALEGQTMDQRRILMQDMDTALRNNAMRVANVAKALQTRHQSPSTGRSMPVSDYEMPRQLSLPFMGSASPMSPGDASPRGVETPGTGPIWASRSFAATPSGASPRLDAALAMAEQRIADGNDGEDEELWGSLRDAAVAAAMGAISEAVETPSSQREMWTSLREAAVTAALTAITSAVVDDEDQQLQRSRRDSDVSVASSIADGELGLASYGMRYSGLFVRACKRMRAMRLCRAVFAGWSAVGRQERDRHRWEQDSAGDRRSAIDNAVDGHREEAEKRYNAYLDELGAHEATKAALASREQSTIAAAALVWRRLCTSAMHRCFNAWRQTVRQERGFELLNTWMEQRWRSELGRLGAARQRRALRNVFASWRNSCLLDDRVRIMLQRRALRLLVACLRSWHGYLADQKRLAAQIHRMKTLHRVGGGHLAHFARRVFGAWRKWVVAERKCHTYLHAAHRRSLTHIFACWSSLLHRCDNVDLDPVVRLSLDLVGSQMPGKVVRRDHRAPIKIQMAWRLREQSLEVARLCTLLRHSERARVQLEDEREQAVDQAEWLQTAVRRLAKGSRIAVAEAGRMNADRSVAADRVRALENALAVRQAQHKGRAGSRSAVRGVQ